VLETVRWKKTKVMFIWIKDAASIISVRMTVQIIEDQKQNTMAVSSGAEVSPAQQRTSASLRR